MSNITLKPCPFCGGEVNEGCYPTDYPTSHCRAYVECSKCGLMINEDGRVSDADRLLEEAIKKWNTRKPMERIVEQLEKEKVNIVNESDSYTLDRAIEIVQKGGAE